MDQVSNIKRQKEEEILEMLTGFRNEKEAIQEKAQNDKQKI